MKKLSAVAAIAAMPVGCGLFTSEKGSDPFFLLFSIKGCEGKQP